MSINDYLPDELLVSIFSHLTIKDLKAVSAVCRRWRQASSDDYIWRPLCLRSFPRIADEQPVSITWKQRYCAARKLYEMFNQSVMQPQGPELKEINRGHLRPIKGWCVVPQQRISITAGDDRKIIVWDLNTLRELFEVRLPLRPKEGVAVFTGHWFATLGYEREFFTKLQIVDLSRRETVAMPGAEFLPMTQIFAGEGCLVGATLFKTIHVWNLERREVLGRFRVTVDSIQNVALHKDLVLVTGINKFAIYTLRGEEVFTLNRNIACWSTVENTRIVLASHQDIFILNLATLTVERFYENILQQRITVCKWNGDEILVGSNTGWLAILSHKIKKFEITCFRIVNIIPFYKYLIIGTKESGFNIWDRKLKTTVKKLNLPYPMKKLAIVDSKVIVCGNKSLYLCDFGLAS